MFLFYLCNGMYLITNIIDIMCNIFEYFSNIV